jgi:acyl-[acyl-carrier-protein]-phospholipid O-acyltransferase/long-chain-fatty-acid--[acyl-carrier-protein] ligase
MEGLDCPIVPAYIHDAWGSIFSWKDGRAIFKWPKQIPYRVTISYGEAMSAQATAAEVEAAVRALGEDAGAGEDASAGEDAGEGVTELRVKK